MAAQNLPDVGRFYLSTHLEVPVEGIECREPGCDWEALPLPVKTSRKLGYCWYHFLEKRVKPEYRERAKMLRRAIEYRLRGVTGVEFEDFPHIHNMENRKRWNDLIQEANDWLWSVMHPPGQRSYGLPKKDEIRRWMILSKPCCGSFASKYRKCIGCDKGICSSCAFGGPGRDGRTYTTRFPMYEDEYYHGKTSGGRLICEDCWYADSEGLDDYVTSQHDIISEKARRYSAEHGSPSESAHFLYIDNEDWQLLEDDDDDWD